MTLSAAGNVLRVQHDIPAFLVKLPDAGWYAMTREEFDTLAAAKPPDALLSSILKPDRIPSLFPDLPLDSALPHLSRWPILPVQNRAQRGAIEGIVTLEDVLSRYQTS
jgi:CIC family chloride channel protein